MKRLDIQTTLFAAALFCAAPAFAAEETVYEAIPDQEQIEQQTIQAAEDALRETESFATSISFAFDYLTTFMSEAGPPDFLTHAELKASTTRIDGVRSILVIGKDGSLQHDAFTFPAPSINLGERRYVLNALARPGLVIGEAVVGQTSGVPFVPVSTFKPALNAVLAAIVDTRVVREPLNWCPGSCGGAVLTSQGKVVAASPPEAPIPDEIISRILADENNQGSFVYERQSFKALIAFRKSERFPVIILASHALTTSGALATQ
jgi:hypothetical protein